MSIGKAIGRVRHTFATTLDGGDKVTLTVEFDFSNSDDQAIRQWLVSDRTIALQRQLRKLSLEEARELDNKVVPAETAGRKIASESDTIKMLVMAGVPEAIAKTIVRNPALVEEAFKKVNADNDN